MGRTDAAHVVGAWDFPLSRVEIVHRAILCYENELWLSNQCESKLVDHIDLLEARIQELAGQDCEERRQAVAEPQLQQQVDKLAQEKARLAEENQLLVESCRQANSAAALATAATYSAPPHVNLSGFPSMGAEMGRTLWDVQHTQGQTDNQMVGSSMHALHTQGQTDNQAAMHPFAKLLEELSGVRQDRARRSMDAQQPPAAEHTAKQAVEQVHTRRHAVEQGHTRRQAVEQAQERRVNTQAEAPVARGRRRRVSFAMTFDAQNNEAQTNVEVGRTWRPTANIGKSGKKGGGGKGKKGDGKGDRPRSDFGGDAHQESARVQSQAASFGHGKGSSATSSTHVYIGGHGKSGSGSASSSSHVYPCGVQALFNAAEAFEARQSAAGRFSTGLDSNSHHPNGMGRSGRRGGKGARSGGGGGGAGKKGGGKRR